MIIFINAVAFPAGTVYILTFSLLALVHRAVIWEGAAAGSVSSKRLSRVRAISRCAHQKRSASRRPSRNFFLATATLVGGGSESASLPSAGFSLISLASR